MQTICPIMLNNNLQIMPTKFYLLKIFIIISLYQYIPLMQYTNSIDKEVIYTEKPV